MRYIRHYILLFHIYIYINIMAFVQIFNNLHNLLILDISATFDN